MGSHGGTKGWALIFWEALALLFLVFVDNHPLFAEADVRKAGSPAKNYPSLFFEEKEGSQRPEGTQEALPRAQLSLSGIFYSDDHHWTLWINGRVIRPESSPEVAGLRIEKVTAHEVRFSHLSPDGSSLKRGTILVRSIFAHPPH